MNKLPYVHYVDKCKKTSLKYAVTTLSAFALMHSAHSQDDTIDEELFELSPFVIETSENTYSATSTLSGTRIKTDVSDVGSSISILTEQLMEDVSGTDAGSLLTIVPNVEVGGELGNYSSASVNGASLSYETDRDRLSSGAHQRVRGLDGAQRTRNYFGTFVPFDSYNTSRLTVNRGPNSVLFGLGGAGGVMESSMARPLLIDENEIQIALNQYGGHREVFDFNRILTKDGRLKVRAILLNEEKQYRQKEAFSNQKRAYFTWDYKLRDADDSAFFGDTTFRGYFETGDMDRNPPEIVPPSIFYQMWHNLDYINEVIGKYPGINTQADLATVVGGRSYFIPVEDGGSWRPNAIIDNTDLSTYRDSNILTAIYNTGFVYDQPNSSNRNIYGFDGFRGRAVYGGSRNRQDHKITWGQSFSGFTAPTLMNRNVFDFVKHMYTGNTDDIQEEFNVQEFALEQALWGGKAGVEIAYNKQTRDEYQYTPYSGGRGRRIVLDVSKYVTIPAGGVPSEEGNIDPLMAENPNVGRPMIGFRDAFERDNNERTYESFRATAYATHDFRDNFDNWVGKVIGKHTVSGLFQRFTDTSRRERERLSYSSDTHDLQAIWGGYNNGDRQVQSLVYVGPSAIGTSSIDEVKLDFPMTRAIVPQAGETFSLAYWDRPAGQFKSYDGYTEWIGQPGWRSDTGREITESDAFIIQSDWLDDHLTTLFAWRSDELERYERADSANQREPDGSFNFANLVLSDDPASVVSGDTFTQSYVLEYPEKYIGELPFGADLRFSYFESESFNPSGIARDIYGEILPDPNSTTKEYGVAVDLFERRLSFRINWFETASNANRNNSGLGGMNSWAGSGGIWLERVADYERQGYTVDSIPGNNGQIASYEQLYDILTNVTPEYFRKNISVDVDREHGTVTGVGIDGLSSTEARVAKGIELEVVGAITDNWNIMFNISKQETVTSNVQPGVLDFVQEIENNLKSNGLWDMWDSPAQGGEGSTYGDRFGWHFMEPALNVLATEGQISPEQRKWRWNLVSTYSFNDGRLKGFRIGGLLRWQDKSAIGYPKLFQNGNLVNDVANPYYGDTELNGDAWVSYNRKIWNDKIDWKIQLNIRNLIGGDPDSFIPISKDPIGRVQAIRTSPERQIILTNTFRF